MRRDDTLHHWETTQEHSHDRRTGAVIVVYKNAGNWTWQIVHRNGSKTAGASSRKSARAAARKLVRTLPDANKPKKQLDLF